MLQKLMTNKNAVNDFNDDVLILSTEKQNEDIIDGIN